jgi:hypothetical protein
MVFGILGRTDAMQLMQAVRSEVRSAWWGSAVGSGN